MNTEIWDKVKRPPPEALKTIQAGRLKGMTDIKPQWRIQVMTEVFGPCGVGWKYTIDNLWTTEGSEGQLIAFAQVSLYIRFNDAWSDPIPGVGGSMIVANESRGPHTSDEGYKMALTDALSVAMKQLGVAADIYSGLWDGSKYIEAAKEDDRVKIPAKVKKAVYEQSVACLSAGDEQGLMEIWAEFGPDEKAVLWADFNSEQRRAMKELMKGAAVG